MVTRLVMPLAWIAAGLAFAVAMVWPPIARSELSFWLGALLAAPMVVLIMFRRPLQLDRIPAWVGWTGSGLLWACGATWVVLEPNASSYWVGGMLCLPLFLMLLERERDARERSGGGDMSGPPADFG